MRGNLCQSNRLRWSDTVGFIPRRGIQCSDVVCSSLLPFTVRVEFPAISAGQAWLQGTGESRNWASAARAVSDAITQAVREIYRQLAALREAVGPREEAPRSVSDDTTGQG